MITKFSMASHSYGAKNNTMNNSFVFHTKENVGQKIFRES